MDFLPFQKFRKEVEALLQRVFEQLKIQAKPILEIPLLGIADLAFPSYSLESLAKERQIKDITSLLCKKSKELLTEFGSKWIKAVERKGNYLNFYIDQEILTRKTLEEVASTKSSYGKLSPKSKTILLEHTSANPSGPLHIGRARNPIIGDTLARIFRVAGYKVETQFYVDDVGKQVAILTWGVKNLAEESLPPCTRQKGDHKLVRYYQKANELMQSNKSVAAQINELVRAFESGKERAWIETKQVYQEVLKGILQSLDRINVRFDSFVNESTMIKNESTQKVVEGLKQSKYANHEGLAWYLDLKEFGIKGEDTNFYFTRGDGTSLYATRDIAYHLWKAEQADYLVNVLGEDHKLEAKQVEIALDLLKARQKLRSIFYAFVSLPEGRMSTRKGRVVYLDDLIDEAIDLAYQEVKKRRGAELSEAQLTKVAEWVGIGAIRYNILRVQPEKAIKFKWEEALSFEGNSAPFIQYAHARCSSILKKAGKEAEPKSVNHSLLSHPCEIALAKHIAKFPELIKSVAQNFKPNSLASYAYELATLFNQFYRDCRVIGSGKFESPRLVLVKAAAQTLKNSLNLLGINAPEYM